MKWPRFRKMVTLLGCIVICFCRAGHRLTATPITITMRVASIKNVTELLIVVGGQLQGLSDILRRQLVRLDTVWYQNHSNRAVRP